MKHAIFTHKGKNLCRLAAFKHIMVMGFWRALNDPSKTLKVEPKTEMGHLG
jgi:hypothetical protein